MEDKETSIRITTIGVTPHFHCSKCGRETASGIPYCGYCGRKFNGKAFIHTPSTRRECNDT